MKTECAALDALAEHYGIESEFIDANGTRQQTSDRTQRALLAALGVRATDNAALTAVLQAVRAEDWQRALPPVLVARPETLRIPVVVTPDTTAIDWTLTTEQGDQRVGSAEVAGLAVLERQPDGGERVRRELVLPSDIALGYHRLRVDSGTAEMSLIVTPGACWLPPAVEAGERLAGIAAQLYLLRSADN